MPSRQSALRRRQSAAQRSQSPSRQPAAAPPLGRPQVLLASLAPVFSKLAPVYRALAACGMGVVCAASLTRSDAAIVLFIASLVVIFASLLLVFMSIMRAKDRTPVPLPNVYRSDGTVVKPAAMTVYDHDHKLATYYSSELPALALAAAWFFLWVHMRPAFLALAAYLAFRLFYHPLFRIHLWKEPMCPELQRPFGAAPLFHPDDVSAVHHVAGTDQFDKAIADAGADRAVIVDFSAAWCGPCRALAPKFREIANDFQERATFLAVDVGESQDVAARMAISTVPSFVIFKNAERLELLRGPSPSTLRETVERYL